MGLTYYLSKMMGEQARCPKSGTFLGWLARIGMGSNVGMAKEMIQISNPKSESVIVELGPGNGQVLQILFEENNPSRVYGVEISDAFRESLEEKFAQEIQSSNTNNNDASSIGRLSIHEDDAKSLPFIQDSSVDYVYAMNVIYFLEPLSEYMNEMYRILKPTSGQIMWGIDERAARNNPDVFKTTDWNKCMEAMKDAKFENVKKDETYKDNSHIFLKATKG